MFVLFVYQQTNMHSHINVDIGVVNENQISEHIGPETAHAARHWSDRRCLAMFALLDNLLIQFMNCLGKGEALTSDV